MHSLELAVVGSGIGGSLVSALNKEKELLLFEKGDSPGGCAATFERFGNLYNAGATTFAGYEEGHILKKHFDAVGAKPDIVKSDIAMRVVQKGSAIDRGKDFEKFLDDINRVYPNRNNRVFWSRIRDIDQKFWRLRKIYYGKYSFSNYACTASFAAELLRVFGLDLFKSAASFIKGVLGEISGEYQSFLDSQLLITVQSSSKNISLLSMALGLSYPFHDVFYAKGGMGSLIEEILKDVEVKTQEEIQKIKKDGKNWILESPKGVYRAKNLVLNTSVYQSSSLFEDGGIKRYYDSFPFSDQSAFTVYMTIESREKFLDHYQFIYDEPLPNCISNSIFVSFGRGDDKKLSKNGLSITISTHTKALLWKNMPKSRYKAEKQKTMEFIVEKFLQYFTGVKKEDILRCFSATSFTFNRYINRYNCGGEAIGFNNITRIPGCNTPFKGLYNIGDTVFAGQGWPGVAIGVDVLQRQLNGNL